MLGLIFIIIILSLIIKSPDKVYGRCVLTTTQPPIELYAKHIGLIQRLHIADMQNVKRGDVLVEIESSTTYSNIEYLVRLLKIIRNAIEREQLISIANNADLHLGEGMPYYNALVKEYKEYIELHTNLNYQVKQNEFRKALKFETERLKIYDNQIRLFKEQLENSKQKNEIDKRLYREMVIAKMDFLKENNTHIQKMIDFESLKILKIEHELKVLDIDKQLHDFEFTYQEKQRICLQNLNENLRNVDNFIAQWEQSYVIKAPFDGVLVYAQPLAEKQLVNSEENLFTVVSKDLKYIAYATVTSDRAGKIEVGQKVRIAFDQFPSAQFGKISGKVLAISLLPSHANDASEASSSYRVTIAIDNTAKTSFGKSILLKPKMTGLTEIFTDNLTLAERVLYHFRKMSRYGD